MARLSHKNIANSLTFLATCLGCVHIGVFLFIAFSTVAYPFQLQFMEGGTADVIRRILSGKDIYAKPSLDYVAYIYAPLYYYVSSFVSAMLGEGLTAPRLVSLAATFGNALLIYSLVRNEGCSRLLGLLAIGFFASCFVLSGRWYHIARVDSLYLFFLLAGALVLRVTNTASGAISAGVIWGLAFLTKQPALLVVVLAVAVMSVADPKRMATLALTFIAVAAGSSLWLNTTSNGWFFYYTFELPSTHALVKSRATGFWISDLLGDTWIATSLSALCLLLLARSRQPSRFFYLGLAAGMIGSSFVSRLHSGGYVNDLMPTYAILSILMPVGISLVGRRAADWNITRDRKELIHAGLMLAVSCQFLLLVVDPRLSIPTARDYQAGERFLEYLEQIPGDVLIFRHRFIQTRAGKKSYGLGAAAGDVLRSHGNVRDALYEEIQAAIRRERFDAIILNRENARQLQPALSEAYELRTRIFVDDSSYYPVTGIRGRPDYVFVPKKG